jgi:hypothetical protein
MKNFENIYMSRKHKNASKGGNGSRLSSVASNEPASRLNRDIAIAPKSQSPLKKIHNRRFAATNKTSRRQVYGENGDDYGLHQDSR